MTEGQKMFERAQESQIAHLKKTLREYEGQIKKLNESEGERREFFEMIAGAITAAEPFAKFQYKNPRKKKDPIIPILKLSDWHIGEVIQKSETEGFGEFSYVIAEKRIFGIIEDFLQWVEIQRTVYEINECAIFTEGDFISGDIHQELLVTNEFPLPIQTARAGLLLGECLRIVAPHFETVKVYEVDADNHSRLQRKPQAKQKSGNSMGYLVHTIANLYAEKCINVKPIIADGAKYLANVNNKKFLIEHGDGIRGQMGIPYYGFQRLVGKEAKRRMNTDKGFDYLSIGHFHVPAIIESTVLVNGSLSGTSEYDHLAGRHAPPGQVAFLVHAHHGIFNWTAFRGR